jgi:hypothetical protein
VIDDERARAAAVEAAAGDVTRAETDLIVYVWSVNVAVTDDACASVTEHVGDVPEQAPPHPVNTDPTSGSAVRTMIVSGG